MFALPITATTAAILALMMFPLTMIVSLKRIDIGKSTGNLTEAAIGEYDDETLKRRIRAFGSFIEYVPMCLIMMVLLELSGGPSKLLWAIGLALVVGRVIHAGGMLYATNPVFRASGMMLTYFAFVAPAVWILYSVVS